MATLPEVSDTSVSYVAAQLRLLADLVEAHRPMRFEVPSDKSYIEREDGGIETFAVLVQFGPGVFIVPKAGD